MYLNKILSIFIFNTIFNFITICSDRNIGYVFHDLLRRENYSKNLIKTTIEKDGYPFEEHHTTTPDGYILTLHRIPYSFKTKCKDKSLPPVYLHHGLLANADTWLVLGKNDSLPYILSDAGYDVWLGNARGSTHSRKHTKLNVNSYNYYDFTWHEIGIYDNPTNIDYILSVTKKTQLHYIGHSQGTTSFFVMASLKPEYNKKIKTMHALSPVAFMKHTTSPYFLIPSQLIEQYMFLAKYLGFIEYLPSNYISGVLSKVCKNIRNPSMNVCAQLLFLGGGYSLKQFDPNLVSNFFDVAPGGAAVFQLLHYSQSIKTGEFQTFDYGADENLRKYGSRTPIRYPVEKISAPMYFYVSGNDFISSLDDVNLLLERLKRKPTYIEVEDKNFNHFDYIIGKNAKSLIYDLVLSEMYKIDGVECALI